MCAWRLVLLYQPQVWLSMPPTNVKEILNIYQLDRLDMSVDTTVSIKTLCQPSCFLEKTPCFYLSTLMLKPSILILFNTSFYVKTFLYLLSTNEDHGFYLFPMPSVSILISSVGPFVRHHTTSLEISRTVSLQCRKASSRSHAIFQLRISKRERVFEAAKTGQKVECTIARRQAVVVWSQGSQIGQIWRASDWKMKLDGFF